MKKENNIIEEKIEEKKDFHPLWIYFTGTIALPIIITMVITIAMVILNPTNGLENVLNISNIISLALSFIVAGVFFIMYFKKIKKDIKKITKKQVIFTIIVSIVAVILNEIICQIFEKLSVNMTNQDQIIDLISSYKILMILLCAILIPFTEEVVFRYSLGSLIKNKVVFVIVSSILFGIMHGIELATLLYIFIGAIYAIIYIKTDKNIIASTIAHVINNIIGIILILFLVV